MQAPSLPVPAAVAHPVLPSQVAQWSPHGTSSFVVSFDSALKLYRWHPKGNRIELLAAQSDTSHIKCLSWSPHPLYQDLIAVGDTTGRVEIMRMGDRVLDAVQSSSKPSKISLTSLAKHHPRACHSLSFSPLSPSYLAGGFAEHRGQYSLHAWDIERLAGSLAGPPPLLDDLRVRAYRSSPTLQPDDSMEWPSLKFSSSRSTQSHIQEPESAAGASDSFVADGFNSIRRYAFGELISSVCFLPNQSQVIAVGAGSRVLRIYDLRTAGDKPTEVESTAVHGICFDPFDVTKMASFGDDGVVQFWDVRKTVQPTLSLPTWKAMPEDGTSEPSLAHIAFSPARKGLFGTLDIDARYMRFWTIMSSDAVQIAVDEGDATARIIANESSRDYMSAKAPNGIEQTRTFTPVVGAMHPGPLLSRNIKVFTFVPPIANLPTATHGFILSTSEERGVDIWRPPVSIQHVWSSRGELASGSGGAYRLQPTTEVEGASNNPWTLHIQRAEHSRDETHNSNVNVEENENEERLGRVPFPSAKDSLAIKVAASKRQSSLSATRNLHVSEQPSLLHPSASAASHTPNSRRRSPPRRATTRQTASNITLTVTGSQRVHDPRTLNDTAKTMRGDISEVMRARVLLGYGMDSMTHNGRIASNYWTPGVDVLHSLWAWLESSRGSSDVESSRVYGFDFAYQGALSIWEGFSPLSARALQSDEPPGPPLTRSTSGRGGRRVSRTKSTMDPARLQYETAIEAMTGRRYSGIKKDLPKAAFPSLRPTRRQYALGLYDWDMNDEEFDVQISLWEDDRSTARAACWSVFLQQPERAIEILLRSTDESLVMLSATIQLLMEDQNALGTNEKVRESPWRSNIERLMVRLGGIYIRAMLSRLIGSSWMDILVSEITMPLRERLAIALLFLPDEELPKYLRSVVEDMIRDGDIEAILITGLNPLGLDVIQAYIDNTGDVQTAATLASFVSPTRWRIERKSTDHRPSRWVSTYQNLLDSWKLFHHRCQFDLLRGEVNSATIRDGGMAPFEWVPRQMEVRCNYCSKLINSPHPIDAGPPGMGAATSRERVRSDFCPTCRRKLPRCAVCMITTGMVNEEDRYAGLSEAPNTHDTADDAMVFCQACRHGGHSSHILDWFFGDMPGKTHSLCPVADCTCRCVEYF